MTPEEVLSLWQWAKRMYVETGQEQYQTVTTLCREYAEEQLSFIGKIDIEEDPAVVVHARNSWQSILDKMQ